ncbi:putative acyl-activating enzyme 1, peroxisomal [Artemisia annua]|uniref:Putative acyl-activating enzyme 1, peroxisomal n=1 Tax=Artemisia annua TaxID=35608 RepID=A0A2U1PFA7_ARTAN|nr:putative acyl-activating enzyme 1, peroxisomal [Artemisia annua]
MVLRSTFKAFQDDYIDFHYNSVSLDFHGSMEDWVMEQILVAVLAPNIPEMYELHFAVPMAGELLCTLNICYDSTMVSTLLKNSDAKLIFVDYQFLDVAKGALEIISESMPTIPQLVLIPDSEKLSILPKSEIMEDEALWQWEILILRSEDRMMTQGSTYVSLRTVNVKDIFECISHHKVTHMGGAPTVLNMIINAPASEKLPLPGKVSMMTAGVRGVSLMWSHRNIWFRNSLHMETRVELPTTGHTSENQITTSTMESVIFRHPAVLEAVVVGRPDGHWGETPCAFVKKKVCMDLCNRSVRASGCLCTCLLFLKGKVNFRTVNAKDIFECISHHKVTHMGGAPTVLNMIINAPASEKLPLPGKLGFKVYHSCGLIETYGSATVCTWKPEWNSLPPDIRARIKSRQGVNHLGLEEVDIKDPVTMKSIMWDAKTIGTMESVIFRHPAVLEAAVVGRPDGHWGETPCAFVKVKEGYKLNGDELIAFCRKNLPHYVTPRIVVFEELPKTSTEKTQKFILREKAKAMTNGEFIIKMKEQTIIRRRYAWIYATAQFVLVVVFALVFYSSKLHVPGILSALLATFAGFGGATTFSAKDIFECISHHKVTHMGGAPTVLNMIINAPASEKLPLPGKLGFKVYHSCGLIETYGSATVCTWKPEWNSLPPDIRARIKSRQGVNHLGLEEVDIKDPVTMKSIMWDAKTIGTMESVIFRHPAVLEAAVVGRPDGHWGETPCAFVKVKEGYKLNGDELIAFCRKNLPHYMTPRTVVFEEFPKTSTEKTQNQKKVCMDLCNRSVRASDCLCTCLLFFKGKVNFRTVNAKDIFECISHHKLTHMGGALTVLNMIINAPASEKLPLPGKVSMMTVLEAAVVGRPDGHWGETPCAFVKKKVCMDLCNRSVRASGCLCTCLLLLKDITGLKCKLFCEKRSTFTPTSSITITKNTHNLKPNNKNLTIRLIHLKHYNNNNPMLQLSVDVATHQKSDATALAHGPDVTRVLKYDIGYLCSIMFIIEVASRAFRQVSKDESYDFKNLQFRSTVSGL